MAIWMDMTYSMSVWQGGLVGIIRAELEMAKNLHAVNKEVRFCRATMTGYVEIKHEELEWLWNAKKIGDAYLERMGRNTKEQKATDADLPDGLKKAYAYSGGRLDRIKRFLHMGISRTPKYAKPISYLFAGAVYLPIKTLSMGRQLVLHRRLVDKGNADPSKEICKLNSHPFKNGDTLFAGGWYSFEGIIKESLISKIKNELRNFKLVYLIYDLVLVNENTAPLYDAKENFERYLIWAASNCNHLIFGGATAQSDAKEFFDKLDFTSIRSDYVKFGSDVSIPNETLSIDKIKKKYNIQGDYILSVGTVDAKKNYSTVYHAYTMLHESADNKNLPQWLIVGGKYGDPWLSEAMELDIRVKDKIRFARPTDDELVVLYQNCLFTMLPTWYEGWSLTLPESLEHGKFCLASDVAPLREIGGDMIEYVAPDDAKAWAERIEYFSKHHEEVEQKNKRIEKEYKPVHWSDTGVMINDIITKVHHRKGVTPDSHFYYDISLAFWSGVNGANVSGILRTQLLLARYLGRMYPNMKFIAFTERGYKLVDRFLLTELLSDSSIDQAFNAIGRVFKYLDNEMKGIKVDKIKKEVNHTYSNGEVFWMLASIMPKFVRKKMVDFSFSHRHRNLTDSVLTGEYKLPFSSNDILFSTGVGLNAGAYKTMNNMKDKNNFKLVQLLYDFTPVLYPQVHTKDTRFFYDIFLKNSFETSEIIFYGGETAMRDGQIYAEKLGLPKRESFAVRFGSNIVSNKNINKEKLKKEYFERIGIDKDYIMAVGSIEVRKNHETLYLAYLDMLEKYEDVPMMLFCGYPGWKTEEFLKRLDRDERVKDKIKVITPSDEEMDILYRNCLFTVLASLYEGWSLTLPESLNYGKLCITTKADPMIEIGGDYLDYVDAFDVKGWSETIMKYYNDREYLKEKEERLQKEWKPISWKDCATQVGDELERIYKKGLEKSNE